jgi:hypothetical protein
LPIITPSTGGGGTNGNQPVAPAVLGPKKTITNIAAYLSCLNPGLPANLTIFAEAGIVGHAFISISQGANTMTFGFYPSPGNSITSQGVFGENGGGAYNGSGAYTAAWNMGTISATQLQQIMIKANYFQGHNYHVITNNCADFAISAMMIAGVNTNTNGFDTPGTVISLMGSNVTSTNGVAPTTHRTCP